MPDTNESTWFPLVSSKDLPFRHAYRSKLLGRDLVIWRADDGFPNVWVDRCLHRGTRLSLGLVNGSELKCQYHGWLYSNRTGGCTYIPAHPVDSPAQTLSCQIFKVQEKHGFVWSGIEPTGALPNILGASADDGVIVLRSIIIRGSASLVIEALADYRFKIDPRSEELSGICRITGVNEFSIQVVNDCVSSKATLTLFVQPVDEEMSIVHGVLHQRVTLDNKILILRHHNDVLTKLRTKIENSVIYSTTPVSSPRAVESSSAPNLSHQSVMLYSTRLKARVTQKWDTAEGIVGIELSPVGADNFPTFLPGAHIDLYLPNQLTRQYSLTNGPGAVDKYLIGVKREPQSRGGSHYLHDILRVGDQIDISPPRNNFHLRRDSSRTILIAGGIGVTPLLSMAQTLQRQNLNFTLYYFAQGTNHLAFPEITKGLGVNFFPHLGLSPSETMGIVINSIGNYSSSENVYLCGPQPLINGARELAVDLGWPEEAIHFEYFKNTKVVHKDSSFVVDLARSALSLNVEPGQTILEVIRESGVIVSSSCEQGACGTCLVRVLEGTPDHQDVYLNETEKQSCKVILVCVSRALTARMTLDV